MKKVLLVILALTVLLSLSVTAFAAGPESGTDNASQQMPGIMQQGQVPNGRPEMGGQPPMVNGEVPAMNGQQPEMNGQISGMGGRPPMMNRQAPDREAPADLPEHPDMGGEAPEMNGRPPMMNGQHPGFVDFDAMAAEGVISQETLENIKAYMEENKPADLPDIDGDVPQKNGQPPEMDGQPPEMNGEAPAFDGEDSMVDSLLNDLLEAGIITQAEYDAVCKAISK